MAFTAAACGVPIAKHGNRSASGKVGSADVLEGLGLELKAPPATVVDAINAAGVTFLLHRHGTPLWSIWRRYAAAWVSARCSTF